MRKVRVRRVGDDLYQVAVDGRATGMGARTGLLMPESMQRIPAGRTHWVDIAEVRPGDEIAVRDVSNRGHHYCWRGRLTEAGEIEVVERAEAGWPCPICDGSAGEA